MARFTLPFFEHKDSVNTEACNLYTVELQFKQI